MGDVKEKEVKSTLGLSDTDYDELMSNAEKQDTEREVKGKVENKEFNFTPKTLLWMSISSLILGILVITIADVIRPEFTLNVTDFEGYSLMIIVMVLYLIIQNLWLPLLFEVFVLLFKDKIGKFFQTWTIITLLLDVTGVVGLVLTLFI